MYLQREFIAHTGEVGPTIHMGLYALAKRAGLPSISYEFIAAVLGNVRDRQTHNCQAPPNVSEQNPIA